MANLSDMSGLGAGAPQGTPAPPAPPSDPHSPLRGRLLSSHSAAKAQFDKTSELVSRADRARTGFLALTSLGDSVSPEDVIGEAGKMVAAGEDPLVLAGVLADMPSNGGGAALAGWVQAQMAKAQQMEAQIMQAHNAARHQLGVSALHVLQAHGPGQISPSPAPNPLAPAPSPAPSLVPGAPS